MQANALKQEPDCKECPIRNRAVCARCDEAEFGVLDQIKYYRHYDAGQTIVWAGDEMGFVGSIMSGVATISQTLEDGRTQMVGLLLSSDFLGRPGRERSVHDVTAVTPVTLCCFRRKPFEQVMRDTPRLAGRLLEMTMDELDNTREWMLILGRKTAREKIASLLTILARREAAASGAPRGDLVIDLPLTRDSIADYLGLTLETVSRQMSALKRDGIIVLEGKRRVRVPDLRRLMAETGDDIDGGVIS